MTQPTIDHDVLLIAIAQGDHQAFVALYQAEAPRMLALAKKMLVRSADAQDAVKDTFVLIWKHAESCDTTMTSARAWIYSIFRHRTMSTLREPGRMVPVAGNWTDHLPSQASVGTRPSPVHTALQHLDAAQRRPLLMAYYHGYKPRQIAVKLGSTPEQIRQHIQQGLRALHEVGQP